MHIFRTPYLLRALFPEMIWRMPAASRDVFLTFDDGPVPGPTEFVLDELGARDIKATFFCIGDNVRKHPHIFERIKSGRHAIGNHTYHHVKGWSTTTEAYKHDVDICSDELTRHGVATTLFRPPYGRITRAQARALRGYQMVMWDVLTNDYDRSLDADRCLHRSVRVVRPGSIVVFHDSVKAEKNLRFVLPRFIDHLSAGGYSFKTLA